jgi:hypothetical protein
MGYFVDLEKKLQFFYFKRELNLQGFSDTTSVFLSGEKSPDLDHPF